MNLKLWHEEKTEEDDFNIYKWYVNSFNGINHVKSIDDFPPPDIYPRTKIIGKLNLLNENFKHFFLDIKRQNILQLIHETIGCYFEDIPDLLRNNINFDRLVEMNFGKIINYVRRKLNLRPLSDYYLNHCLRNISCISINENSDFWIVSGNSLVLSGSTDGEYLSKGSLAKQDKHFCSCMRAGGVFMFTTYVKFGAFALFNIDTSGQYKDLIGRILAIPFSDEEGNYYMGWGRPYGTFNSNLYFYTIATYKATEFISKKFNVKFIPISIYCGIEKSRDWNKYFTSCNKLRLKSNCIVVNNSFEKLSAFADIFVHLMPGTQSDYNAFKNLKPNDIVYYLQSEFYYHYNKPIIESLKE